MTQLFHALFPELVLMTVACVLLLLGAVNKAGARRAAPVLALLALVFVFGYQITRPDLGQNAMRDPTGTVMVFNFAMYVKLLAAGVGILFILLAWPTNRDATGNAALDYATEAGEFFGLMLLSISGIFLVASANDLILLFLGIELASLPTYIMVSISRPVPAAQEAGVKYFFLGAMAAAIMLFGFSYLYGSTGLINLDQIGRAFHAMVAPGTLERPRLAPWAMLAVVMLVAGFAFKLAAFPLHFYAGDVYQGAATPVTAFLSFVPKASGMVALIKLIYVAGGNSWAAPEQLTKLLWIMAVLTMTIGNTVALWQVNIKRVFAYSSIAHSGYMLVGLTALATGGIDTQEQALRGVLFYLAAYGIMNAGAFGVLMLLPARPMRTWSGQATPIPPATTAETFEDIAGQGRRHPALGLGMAVCCFSLIGLPLTVGFFGKLYLIRPALTAGLYWLVVITMINAAISAAYYLKIVAAMFLRPDPDGEEIADARYARRLPAPLPITAAVVLSVFGTLLFGTIIPATQVLVNQVTPAAQLEPSSQKGAPTATPARTAAAR
jgi:NADH-quinone oxidoreductase subunit N